MWVTRFELAQALSYMAFEARASSLRDFVSRCLNHARLTTPAHPHTIKTKRTLIKKCFPLNLKTILLSDLKS